MDNCILFDNNGTIVPYWFIETDLSNNLDEFLNENEIDAKRYDVKNKTVYLLKDHDDYLTLNTLIKILA